MTDIRAGTENGIRRCDQCGRPLPALHKNEYTPARARLVADLGVCMCTHGDTDGVEVPDRAPSLL
ncbi:hypothetical protein GCM10022251_26190 [Phytohabitans flavus]|uniref:Uncharacterized protein n=1 Tax=Phytohabitans flavus TaxID=1076124 RepID=A0A6F8XPQ8_9ACTN|nr:hypothetical protein [Phytohabitans flavus]BCB75787.1 hypothetical protein Pflav_021970 [Phytohabitans flavus]